MTTNEIELLKVVVVILKKRFNSLTAEEAISLAGEILCAISNNVQK